MFGGVLPYLEVTGHLVPESSLGFMCPDFFIWNCSNMVYPSKIKGPFWDNCLRYYYLRLAFLMAGWVEGIRRALVLGLVFIAGTAIEHRAAKVIEALTLPSINEFLSPAKNKHGFRHRHSTTFALLQLTTDI